VLLLPCRLAVPAACSLPYLFLAPVLDVWVTVGVVTGIPVLGATVAVAVGVVTGVPTRTADAGTGVPITAGVVTGVPTRTAGVVTGVPMTAGVVTGVPTLAGGGGGADRLLSRHPATTGITIAQAATTVNSIVSLIGPTFHSGLPRFAPHLYSFGMSCPVR
jgi:hypothetical protein